MIVLVKLVLVEYRCCDLLTVIISELSLLSLSQPACVANSAADAAIASKGTASS